MKAYKITNATDGTRSWQATEIQQPAPASHEVLVKVHAVSLNYRDAMITNGDYPLPVNEHIFPASDGAGEIVAISSAVTDWKVGDRVCASFFPQWQDGAIAPAKLASSLGGTVNGMLAEYVTLPQNAVVRIPAHLSYEEAATLPCAPLTAWNALMESGAHMTPGQSLLIQGTGGVSIAAAQFALASGLRVIALSSSEQKIEKLHKLGIHETIDYKKHPEWQQEVLRLTDGAGVDHIIEVGGAGTLPRSIEAAKLGGRISLIGVLTGISSQINPVMIMGKNLQVQGILVGSTAMLDTMCRAVETLKLKPVIGATFRFAEAVKALEHQKSGRHFGKIVITVG